MQCFYNTDCTIHVEVMQYFYNTDCTIRLEFVQYFYNTDCTLLIVSLRCKALQIKVEKPACHGLKLTWLLERMLVFCHCYRASVNPYGAEAVWAPAKIPDQDTGLLNQAPSLSRSEQLLLSPSACDGVWVGVWGEFCPVRSELCWDLLVSQSFVTCVVPNHQFVVVILFFGGGGFIKLVP